jgi:hypothetical protein
MPDYTAEKYPERRRCVYALCEAQVTLTVVPPYPGSAEGPRRQQPQHEIVNAHLTGPCPASLMYVGWTPMHVTPIETERALAERYRVDADRAQELYHQQQRDRAQHNRPTPNEDATSRPVVGTGPGGVPNRLGRTPPPNAEEWALGGRQDEDSGHLQQYDVKPPAMKPGIFGQEVGKHVASVHELLVMMQSAAMKGGEAWQAVAAASEQLTSAIGALEEVKGIVGAAQGQSDAETLRNYMYYVQEAITQLLESQVKLEEGKQNILVGQEKGEEFGARLLG